MITSRGEMTLEQTLKITSVLSDATRLHIYEYIAKKHGSVNVQEIAEHFHIHPNVARLHLTKLEDVGMITGRIQKNPKGGRPFRIYKLSDEVINIQFPFRDYEMLSKIALETLLSLGEQGKQALIETGRKFGKRIIENKYSASELEGLSTEDKLSLLHDTSSMLGLDPEYEYNEEDDVFIYRIFNCPFKEVALEDSYHTICEMHRYLIIGMFETIFSNKSTLIEKSNLLDGCQSCSYHVEIKS